MSPNYLLPPILPRGRILTGDRFSCGRLSQMKPYVGALVLVFCLSEGRACAFFFSSRRRHTRYIGDWSSDVLFRSLTFATRVDSSVAKVNGTEISTDQFR